MDQEIVGSSPTIHPIWEGAVIMADAWNGPERNLMHEETRCYRCDRELVRAGVDLGIPYGTHTAHKLMYPKIPFKVLVCVKCKNEVTADT